MSLWWLVAIGFCGGVSFALGCAFAEKFIIPPSPNTTEDREEG
jgi:hypothetical protein